MTYDLTFHRTERLRALTRWSEVGVLEQRARLPIEQAFTDRIARSSEIFFRPVPLHDFNSVKFHRQLSYLIDAFDALPERVDIAFDSTWKAFELASTDFAVGNITDRLKSLASSVDMSVTNRLCASFPVQSCEYLFKRLVSDAIGPGADVRLVNRVNGLQDAGIEQLLTHLRATYGDGTADSRRKGALLLRKALRGDVLDLGLVSGYQLDDLSRARILISLFLYTTRNDRFHGESFSPFVSSAASLRTYTHPYFSFLASYYLLLCVWEGNSSEVLSCDADGINSSLGENLNTAAMVFGRHWER
jgi:hypothetical protein